MNDADKLETFNICPVEAVYVKRHGLYIFVRTNKYNSLKKSILYFQIYFISLSINWHWSLRGIFVIRLMWLIN
jgi:hypothetical protein